MIMRTISLNTGQEMPVIGLGTWEMGGRETADLTNREQYVEAIRQAITLGYRHIDTAEMYGNGEAERIAGEAIRSFNRQELFITSKVWPTNLSHQRLMMSVKKSLQRLHTPYLDALLIHAPNPSVDLRETLGTMVSLKREGAIRCLGVSNFPITLLAEALAEFPNEIAIIQNEYSLQSIDKGLYTSGSHTQIIPFCQQHNIAFTGWRPLGKGQLLKAPRPELEALALKHKATPAQIAIAWAIHHPMTSTLVKASTVNHIQENLDAANLHLDECDYTNLTKAYTG